MNSLVYLYLKIFIVVSEITRVTILQRLLAIGHSLEWMMITYGLIQPLSNYTLSRITTTII